MSETPASKTSITIKKYANRRLYNTATSTYVTLENLSVMVKEGTEFNVYDAKTGEDITRSVLTQIIVEEEGKSGQQNLLPISFLRQLIGFYGDNMQWMVPKYLEYSMQTLANNQEQLRSYFQTAFGNIFPFGTTLEEMSKQQMTMFEQAMRLWAPFAAASCVCSMEDATCGAPEKAAPAASCSVPEAKPVASIIRRAEAAPKSTDTPMPNVQNATASASTAQSDNMQQKIANLQAQLAALAKNRS